MIFDQNKFGGKKKKRKEGLINCTKSSASTKNFTGSNEVKASTYLRFKKLTLDVKLVLKLANDRVPAGCSCLHWRGYQIPLISFLCWFRQRLKIWNVRASRSFEISAKWLEELFAASTRHGKSFPSRWAGEPGVGRWHQIKSSRIYNLKVKFVGVWFHQRSMNRYGNCLKYFSGMSWVNDFYNVRDCLWIIREWN